MALEAMRKYVERTNFHNDRYDILCTDVGALMRMAAISPQHRLDAICLAFEYGQAKGYRAGKAEVKR